MRRSRMHCPVRPQTYPVRMRTRPAGRAPQRRKPPLAQETKRTARLVGEVPIYTIAYGTEDGYIEVSGRREPVPVDRVELLRVSKISGGEAYTAKSAGQLKEVYADIGSSVGKEKVDTEVTARYAGFGLAFAILAALGLVSLAARWP